MTDQEIKQKILEKKAEMPPLLIELRAVDQRQNQLIAEINRLAAEVTTLENTVPEAKDA